MLISEVRADTATRAAERACMAGACMLQASLQVVAHHLRVCRETMPSRLWAHMEAICPPRGRISECNMVSILSFSILHPWDICLGTKPRLEYRCTHFLSHSSRPIKGYPPQQYTSQGRKRPSLLLALNHLQRCSKLLVLRMHNHFRISCLPI